MLLRRLAYGEGYPQTSGTPHIHPNVIADLDTNGFPYNRFDPDTFTDTHTDPEDTHIDPHGNDYTLPYAHPNLHITSYRHTFSNTLVHTNVYPHAHFAPALSDFDIYLHRHLNPYIASNSDKHTHADHWDLPIAESIS